MVSIHAPAWGATACEDAVKTQSGVSIHAPAWGATALRAQVRHLKRGFNPRARVGRDAPTDRPARNRLLFQSTRPRGARRYRAPAP